MNAQHADREHAFMRSQSVRGVAAQETKGPGASREFLDGRQGYDFV